MVYPSSVLTTSPEIIKEFNTLVFHFLGHPNLMFRFPGRVGRSGKKEKRNDHLKGSGCQGRLGC